jgi:hypothetical protein
MALHCSSSWLIRASSSGKFGNSPRSIPESAMALWKDAANQWHVSRHAGSVMRHERFTELIGDIGFDCAIA